MLWRWAHTREADRGFDPAEHLPELKIRVGNVVDLFKLEPSSERPHGLSDADSDALFTTDKPVVFAFHAYPWLIHRLTYRRTNHHNSHDRLLDHIGHRGKMSANKIRFFVSTVCYNTNQPQFIALNRKNWSTPHAARMKRSFSPLAFFAGSPSHFRSARLGRVVF